MNSREAGKESNTSDALTVGIDRGTDIGTVHQGITTDGTYYHGFDTEAIKKFDLCWNLLLKNASASSDVGVNHLGDGCYHNGELYVACVNWSSCPSPWDSGRIGVWNASDLSFVRYVDIAAQNFDPSGCCIDTDDDILWVSAYCGAGTIYQYDLADMAEGTATYVGSIAPSPATSYIQGIEYDRGALYISCNTSLTAGGKVIKMSKAGTGQTTVVPAFVMGESEGLIIDAAGIKLLVAPGTVYQFNHPTKKSALTCPP